VRESSSSVYRRWRYQRLRRRRCVYCIRVYVERVARNIVVREFRCIFPNGPFCTTSPPRPRPHWRCEKDPTVAAAAASPPLPLPYQRHTLCYHLFVRAAFPTHARALGQRKLRTAHESAVYVMTTNRNNKRSTVKNGVNGVSTFTHAYAQRWGTVRTILRVCYTILLHVIAQLYVITKSRTQKFHFDSCSKSCGMFIRTTSPFTTPSVGLTM
jgi:hypothetical protein